ncbi:MAG TPA: hypothetical protein VGG64_21570 [Pirellulales bacterium]
MASPFAVFRKNERWMMAVVGVLAMIAFVFFDPLFGMRSGRGTGDDPVVAETVLYGNIHESELQRMLASRALANQFIQRTIAAAFGYNAQGYFGPDSESDVVDTMLRARKADQMGMKITDDEITRILQLFSNDRLTGEQFAEILQSMSGRKGGISRRQLYDALRTELLSRRLVEGYAGSQQTTPAERWESYQRLNNRAVIEAIPVAVADFVDKVAEPDDAAVQKLFDTYKFNEPQPGAPVPGFKIPAKVAIQYFTAEYEQFEDLDSVSYPEIVNEYERSKDTRYLYSGNLDIPNPEAGASAGDKPDAEKSETAPAGEADSSAEKPADDEKSGGKSDEATPPAADAPASEAAPESKPAAPPQQSRDSRGLLGTELALANVDQAEDEKSEDTKNGTAQAAADAPAAAKPAADAEKEPTDESSAPKKPDPKVMSLKDEYALPTDVTPPKYDPLWKVEPDIRAELARVKAAEKMQEVLTQVREKMVKYGNDRTRWEVKHETDKTLAPPKSLDFNALAAEYHLATHTTNLLTGYELREVDGIGESFVGQGTPFVPYAFGSWQLYQAGMSVDSAGNRYLAWKTEQEPARVPELSEVRDEVVRASKMIEARKPAAEHAKTLSETATKDSITLGELAVRDGLPIVKPDPFSWLTYGSTPNINNRVPPRLSSVTGIEDAGNDFMQVVFSQPEKGKSLAYNNPQTIIYVFQVMEYEPGNEVLRRSFLADDYFTYARVDEPRQRQLLSAWNNSIQQESGLKWVRQPDMRRDRAETDFDDSESGD